MPPLHNEHLESHTCIQGISVRIALASKKGIRIYERTKYPEYI